MSALAQYEAILSLSEKMVELARAQAWEALCEAETERTSLLPKLPKNLSVLSPDEQARITIAITQIKACDSAVLDEVTPWREQVAVLLDRLAPRA